MFLGMQGAYLCHLGVAIPFRQFACLKNATVLKLGLPCLALRTWFSLPSSSDKVLLHFINRDGEKLSATATEGESLLEVVMNQNLNIDGFGVCEGMLACSTCHLIFEEDAFRKLDPISDEELDMLDLAFGLTDTSRLSCQVRVKKWMDGLTVQVPSEVSDIRKDLGVEKQQKQ
ncbi:adrenodoxin-like [Varanus komodoensis]|uniref:adrenodoxin-like n=1 Tax=Varanus komodoensis TaxID=61221 RepID=UPI001CF76B57|nr:adrenodoxin-like [Varanus komodoensis]